MKHHIELFQGSIDNRDRFIKTKLENMIKETVYRSQGEWNDKILKSVHGESVNQTIISKFGIEKKHHMYKWLQNALTDYVNLSKKNKVEVKDGKVISSTLKLNETIELFKEMIELSEKIEAKLESGSKALHQIITDLKELNGEKFIVGGFLRDTIMGRESKDIDFVTSSDYKTMREHFFKKGWLTKETGKDFLVLNVIHKETGERFEIAQFRRDKDNTAGIPGKFIEDAKRRDFTINAIYFDLKRKMLVDPNGQGIDDAKDMIVRFVGKPEERLEEDPIRAIRFYRFLSKGLYPDIKSLKAIRGNFEDILAASRHNRVLLEIERMAFNCCS